jgi:hypothetical protein
MRVRGGSYGPHLARNPSQRAPVATYRAVGGLRQTRADRGERLFASLEAVHEGGIMEKRRISIRTGAGGRSDQRCTRANCVFPDPAISFGPEGHRVVAIWSWLGVEVLDVPNAVKIKLVSALRFVPLSYN